MSKGQTPNPPGYRPYSHQPAYTPGPMSASVGPAAVARNYGYTGTIDHGNGDGTLRAQNTQGEWVTSDKHGRFPEQVEDEQRQADARVQEQQAEQEKRDTLARTNGIVPSTAKWDSRSNLVGGIHAGDGSVISRVNGKLTSDGRPNPQRLQQLSSAAAGVDTGGALQPPQPGTRAVGADVPSTSSTPSAPSAPPSVGGGYSQPQVLAGSPAAAAATLRDVGAASRQDGRPLPATPVAAPARTVADNYRSGSSFDTRQATRDYTAGKISAADLAHVQATAAKVGDSPDPVTPAVQQPLGRQPGSARIIPTTTPAPTIPSADDPQRTTANRIDVAGGGSVTVPAYNGGGAPDGGVYVNGKPMAHGANGALVADLSRASGAPPTVPTSAPGAAPAGQFAAGFQGVSAQTQAMLVQQYPQLAQAGSDQHTQFMDALKASGSDGSDALSVARTLFAPVIPTPIGRVAEGPQDDYSTAKRNDESRTAATQIGQQAVAVAGQAQSLARSVVQPMPQRAADAGLAMERDFGGGGSAADKAPGYQERTAYFQNQALGMPDVYAKPSTPKPPTPTGTPVAPPTNNLAASPVSNPWGGAVPKIGEAPKWGLATGTPASGTPSTSSISGFGDTSLGGSTSKLPTVPTAAFDKPVSLSMSTGVDPSKPPTVPTAPKPDDDEAKKLAASNL